MKVNFLLLILLFVLGCEAKPPEGVTDPGQLLYLGYLKKDVNCSRCHGPEGAGGTQAPDIRTVYRKLDQDTILDIIEYGKGEGSNAMPPFEGKLSETELRALLGFLKSLESVFTDDAHLSN
jgi:mono/diheme cytochrome c family protein